MIILYLLARHGPLYWPLRNASATPWAIKVALETASSFIGQEGQPLPLLAIKLSTVITNSDVTVPKVGLLSNRTDIHGKIYNRLRRVATATYTATQLVRLCRLCSQLHWQIRW